MDLIVDSCQRVILTLVERSTNFLMMEKIKTGKKSEPIAKTVVRLLMPYRKTVKTITTDNGSEFASHQLITKGLHMKGKDDVDSTCYFCNKFAKKLLLSKINCNFARKFLGAKVLRICQSKTLPYC